MPFKIYTYEDPYKLNQADFWNEIASVPHFCGARTLVNGLKDVLEDNIKGLICPLDELVQHENIYKQWTDNISLRVQQYSALSSDFKQLLDKRKISKSFYMALSQNQNHFLEALRLFVELDIPASAIDGSKGNTEQKLFVYMLKRIQTTALFSFPQTPSLDMIKEVIISLASKEVKDCRGPEREKNRCERAVVITAKQPLDIVNEILISHISSDAAESNNQNMSATSMMLYEKIISDVFRTISQRIDSLVNHVEAQESEWMSLDAHLGAADEKTLAMQLFDALKAVEHEKAIADNEYRRQLESIESLKRQREILVNRRVQLIKQIAEKENANDDNARIVKYAAMSIEVLTEFKIRLQKEKVAKLSVTATKCFKELVQKDSLVSAINIDPTTLDVTILDLDGNELLKHQLSAGEQQMFAISIVWALALTSGYKAPVIIDTPMARLDSSHRANFVTKYLPAASSQVVVLSTDEEVYGRYLDLIRDNIADYYTLYYHEEEQCTSIVHGYFGEV